MRSRQRADREHERWKLATDATINDDLLAAGIPLADVVTPTRSALQRNNRLGE